MRITKNILLKQVEILNQTLGYKGEYNEPNAYVLDCAYNAYALHRYTGECGSVNSLTGHIRAGELSQVIQGILQHLWTSPKTKNN